MSFYRISPRPAQEGLTTTVASAYIRSSLPGVMPGHRCQCSRRGVGPACRSTLAAKRPSFPLVSHRPAHSRCVSASEVPQDHSQESVLPPALPSPPACFPFRAGGLTRYQAKPFLLPANPIFYRERPFLLPAIPIFYRERPIFIYREGRFLPVTIIFISI